MVISTQEVNEMSVEQLLHLTNNTQTYNHQQLKYTPTTTTIDQSFFTPPPHNYNHFAPVDDGNTVE